jgi:uncharacterized protein (TIGR02453 family)
MPTPFPGFPKQMPSFFRQLKKNNDRTWFAAHKEIYDEHVRAPMVELVTVINDDLRKFAPFNCAKDPARTIYRIYRDTRFSNDKTPYKDHIGATFARSGFPKHGGAGLYFGVSDRAVEIAGGVYMPGPPELKALRDAIAGDSARFLKLVRDPKVRKSMGDLAGDKLTRPPKGYEAHADSPVAEYLKHKQWYWYVELPASVALTPKLRNEVVSHFRLVADAMDWMNRVLLAARKDEDGDDRPVRPEPMF